MSQTHYLPIKLNTTVLPKTAVFIPGRFQPSTAVNLIVYFHGNIAPFCKTEPEPFKVKGIEYYLDTPLFRCLREDLDASEANAILIAPTLSVKFGSSAPSFSPKYGNLDQANKFDFLVDQTFTRLKESGALPATARPGKIILSAHSAGGVVMMKILRATNALKDSIAECWGFECLYFGTDTWKSWLSANANKQFRHVRQPGVFKDESAVLGHFDNFIDIASGTSHCSLLEERWREAIDASPVLKPPGAMA